MKPNSHTVNLPAGEALLTPEQAAGLLQITKRSLIENARAGHIPAVRINKRVLRFHMPSIVASQGRAL
jgi:hypothetical protein